MHIRLVYCSQDILQDQFVKELFGVLSHGAMLKDSLIFDK